MAYLESVDDARGMNKKYRFFQRVMSKKNKVEDIKSLGKKVSINTIIIYDDRQSLPKRENSYL